jgi:flagellar M-ring protein FliF
VLGQFNQIIKNLSGLGQKKLAILGGLFLFVLAVTVVGAMYINKPAFEPIYVDLEHDDVSQMGAVLSQAGITYDINNEGTSILVPAGQTSRARMVLAENGLPNSSSAGYKLFDNLGSLGLTAFMQEITRVRALEGEIAASIQTIEGVKAARVHIVLAEDGNFRRQERRSTASVVVRYTGIRAETSAASIRHLVAAAVPGLSAEDVTVMDTSGRLLAAGADPVGNNAGGALGLKASVESGVAESVQRALSPFLGDANFRVSVQADISTDKRQVDETIFDPESRVERSVQVVRDEKSLSQSDTSGPVTVEQDIVAAVPTGDAGSSDSERSERREETTNYELNSKRIATVSNGFTVTRLSVAVVVNKQRLAASGGEALSEEAQQQQMATLRALVSAASGVSTERSDLVEISAVDFVEIPAEDGLQSASMLAQIGKLGGTIVNGLAFVIGLVVLALLVVRPALRMLAENGGAPRLDGEASTPLLVGQAGQAAISSENRRAGDLAEWQKTLTAAHEQDDLRAKMRPTPQDKLSMIVDLDEARAAAILRQWVSQEPVQHGA